VIVLDTHAWFWLNHKPQRLSKPAARAIEKADRIGICAISIWEIAIKAEAGKLKFDRPYERWIDDALAADARVTLLHLVPVVSVGAVRLSWDHGDPTDRFIVATARAHDAPLVTSDERIHASKLVRCIWD